MSPIHAHVVRRAVPVRGPMSPMLLVYSFFGVAVIGAVLLTLPVSTSSHDFASPLTAFFTSVSAMTGTGLVVVDTRDAWSIFGQIIISGLIFIGGLGFMTGAAFFLVISGRRSSLQGRIVMRAGLAGSRLGTIGALTKKIVLMAVVVQLVGVILIFVRWYIIDPIWSGMTIGEALWQSIFTSISAFNNAGFDVLPDELLGGASLIGLGRDLPTLTIIAGLIIAGSISYATIANIVSVKGWRRLTLDTKLVLLGMGFILLVGFMAFMISEWSNPSTVGNEAVRSKFAQGAFHTVNRSAGFSTFDYGALRTSDMTVSEGLMFVGGAPASTAAGIKVSTFMVILITSIAIISGRDRTTIFGRRIPRINVQRAMAVGATAVGTVAFLVVTFFAVQPSLDFRMGLFELISAFGNTGWSAGITPNLNSAALIVLMIAMFVGRFGPLTIALFMVGKERQPIVTPPYERIRIG